MGKKICLILPNLNAGGQERVASDLANYFIKNHNDEVIMILFTKADKHYKIDGRVKIYEPRFKSDSSCKVVIAFKALMFIRRTMITTKPDVILSFGEVWNSFVLLSLLFIKTNKFISDRCRPSLKLPIIHRLLRSLLYPTVNGIIAQTETAKQVMYSRIHHPNIKVIGNPIPKISNEKQDRQNIILNVGRFVTEKQQKLLIEIFSEIKIDGWHLIFVGDGHLLENCKQLVKKLNLERIVFFTGQIKNIEEYYLRSKIFAFTSRSEGFPNVLGEALSAGLAVITFNFEAGAQDLVKDQFNGLLIPEGDIKEYKKGLSRLMTDETLRESLVNNAPKSIRKYDTDIICEEYYSFLLS